MEENALLVRENEWDFQCWTRVLATTTDAEVFERFLSKFPRCYAYWDRYARLHGKEIYERAVEANPYCIDTWRCYVEFDRTVLPRAVTQLKSLRPVSGRAYYHPAPLSPSDLNFWRRLLTAEEAAGTADAALYEQCLIPCNDYPEFWLRYALFAGVDVLRRAPQTDDVLMLRAELTELTSVDDARALWSRAKSTETRWAAANFERRQGDDVDFDHHVWASRYHAFVQGDLSTARSKVRDNDAFFHLEAAFHDDTLLHRLTPFPHSVVDDFGPIDDVLHRREATFLNK